MTNTCRDCGNRHNDGGERCYQCVAAMHPGTTRQEYAEDVAEGSVLLADGDWLFVGYGEEVYRVRKGSPVMPDGTFGGMRWFCSFGHWTVSQDRGWYPFEQRAFGL